MNTSFKKMCLVVGVLLLSGCASQLSGSRPDPQRSTEAVELSPLATIEAPQARNVNQKAPMSLRQTLSPKQHNIPDRSPTDALRELTAITNRFDQDANLCESFRSDSQQVMVPRVAKPPFMTYYNDPTFRSKVIRISDTQSGQVVKPMYSTIQGWNSDESLMILYHTGGDSRGHHLYDGKSYKYIRSLNITPSDLEQVFWSHTEPDYYYHVSQGRFPRNQLLKTNARTKKVTRLADFSTMCAVNEKATGGNDVQMQSLDDDLFTFRCKNEATENMYMHAYRVSTGELHSHRIGPGTSWGNWSAPNSAASGTRLLLNGKVIGTDLTTVQQILDMDNSSEHSSLGRTKTGDDALFTVAFAPSPAGCDNGVDRGVGHLVEHNLGTGKCRALITESMGYPYTTSGTHISAVAQFRPGWVVLSSIGFPDDFDSMTNGRPATTFFSEIYLANTDPDNAVVCRVAQHRSFGKRAANGGYQPYFGEPHATISPSGTRILFGSDWYDSGSVDTYVIELPAYNIDQQ